MISKLLYVNASRMPLGSMPSHAEYLQYNLTKIPVSSTAIVNFASILSIWLNGERLNRPTYYLKRPDYSSY